MSKEEISETNVLSQNVINATGELKIKFTNDYMFRAVFQENPKALEGLLYSPMFYSVNKLMDTKNHRIYNDKFTLSVLDLTKIDLATSEDRANELDKWASLFKATTWEEIKMIVKNNESLQEASNSINLLSQDRSVYYRALEREEFLATQRGKDNRMKQMAEMLEQQAGTIEQQAGTIADLEKMVKELQEQLAQQ